MDEELTRIAGALLALKMEVETKKLKCLKERKPFPLHLLELLRELDHLQLMSERAAKTAHDLEFEEREHETLKKAAVMFYSNK